MHTRDGIRRGGSIRRTHVSLQLVSLRLCSLDSPSNFHRHHVFTNCCDPLDARTHPRR
jgi:hypothetical protein